MGGREGRSESISFLRSIQYSVVDRSVNFCTEWRDLDHLLTVGLGSMSAIGIV